MSGTTFKFFILVIYIFSASTCQIISFSSPPNCTALVPHLQPTGRRLGAGGGLHYRFCGLQTFIFALPFCGVGAAVAPNFSLGAGDFLPNRTIYLFFNIQTALFCILFVFNCTIFLIITILISKQYL